MWDPTVVEVERTGLSTTDAERCRALLLHKSFHYSSSGAAGPKCSRATAYSLALKIWGPHSVSKRLRASSLLSSRESISSDHAGS